MISGFFEMHWTTPRKTIPVASTELCPRNFSSYDESHQAWVAMYNDSQVESMRADDFFDVHPHLIVDDAFAQFLFASAAQMLLDAHHFTRKFRE